MVANVFSDAMSSQLEGSAYFQRVLSTEAPPPIHHAIAANLVPKFVEFLQSSSPVLQLDAARALTDISGGSTDQTRAVVNAGAVPASVSLLRSPHDNVREAAFALVQRALPVVAGLFNSDDSEVLDNSCWSLSALSDGSNDQIELVICAGVLPRVVELLGHNSFLVQTPALRCIVNATGSVQQIQRVLDLGALSLLKRLLSSPKRAIRREACAAISNIVAGGNIDQIQAVNRCPPVEVFSEYDCEALVEVDSPAGTVILETTVVVDGVIDDGDNDIPAMRKCGKLHIDVFPTKKQETTSDGAMRLSRAQ